MQRHHFRFGIVCAASRPVLPRQSGATARHGFTLVELLVVIAIIGVLVAMLLPAIQAARESARRSHCINNLKQIGLAIHNYELSRKRLPPGAVWANGPAPVRKGSILFFLLPYLEETALSSSVDPHAANLDDAVRSTQVGSKLVPTYICPSDDHNGLYTPTSGAPNAFAVHNYAASRGPTALYDNPGCSCAHPYSSFAIAPLDDPNNFAGPFTRMGTAIKLSKVTDGLSNTIFFGEVRPNCSESVREGWAYTNNGNGYCSTIIPINYDTCSEQAPNNCARLCNWNTEVGFKSAHSGGAQFLFGDGSVHFLPQTIDHQAYQYLGGKSDGNQVPMDF
jgi:prepilin-type N-terminal cleavage/methylation domain-containing protein/prepilin-type processing-associated H-X9-DG protein